MTTLLLFMQIHIIILFVTKFKKNAGVTYLYTIQILLSSTDCFF